MILGTSKMLSKSGPAALRSITKMFQNIQENYGIILEKYYLCQDGTQQFENVRKLYVLSTMFLFYFRFLLWAFEYVF